MQSEELAALVAAKRANPYHDGMSIESLREATERNAAPVPDGARVTQVDMDGVAGAWIDAGEVDASGATADRVFLFFHGGGYYRGSVTATLATAARFSAACGARCLSVDYRLAPEHPYPAAVDDALTAYRWLLASGTAPQRVVAGGISAGGGLTLALLLRLRRLGEPLPAGAVPMSPWTDLTQSGESYQTRQHLDPSISKAYLDRMAALYAAGHDPRAEELSPLFADHAGLPPLLVQVGTAEVLFDDSTRLAERARAAGTAATLDVWDDMIHGWHGAAHQLAEARQAIDRVGEFFRDCTA